MSLRMRVLNSTQMREADRRTIDEIGIPSLVLMENAGRQVVAATEAIHSDLLERRVAVLCGRGNNGGDGFVVARTLVQRGVEVSVFLMGRVADVRGDARVNLEILGRLGLTVVEVADSQAWELHFSELSDCTLIVDAIFGTGLNAPVSGLIQSVIADVNASGIPVVSIDLPSGLSADSSEPIGDSIEAGLTVTIAAPKLPLVLPPAETRAGDIVIADIGIPFAVLDAVGGPRVELLTRAAMRELITPAQRRQPQGRLRPRPGRRRIARQDGSGPPGGDQRAAVGRRSRHGRDAGQLPGGDCRDGARVHDGRVGRNRTKGSIRHRSTACSISRATSSRSVPAWGRRRRRAHSSRDFVDRATMPLVIDADGLNAFGSDPDRLAGREGRDVIITPHPGEMGRLIGMSSDEVQSSRLEIARNFAVAHHVYVVLKGHRTIIATPDEKVFINPTGNPGMATGGTGDVLTGMIAGWLAQLLDAEAACKLAVYLHGMAGDLAEADEGEVAMTAGDVAGHLGDAILELTARRKVVDRDQGSA